MDLAGNKVYFPVESITGLGHLNRTGKLVRDMVKAGLVVKVVSGSFVDPQRFFAGAQCSEIPPIALKDRHHAFTLSADGKRTILHEFNEAARRSERTAIQLENFHAANANILISEFWPFNRPAVDDEMDALLKASKAGGDKTLRLASIRDVLEPLANDDKTAAEMAAREAWTVKTINDNFDAVLVHGDSNFIPLNETFAAADEIKVPIIYTGYVLDDLPKRTIALKDPDAPVVISCGAGYNCHQLIFSFLTAWQKLLDRRADDPAVASLVNRPVQIITGPRFEPAAFDEVAEWAEIIAQESGQPVTVERYRKDFTSVLANAAFSVSFAGYNTTLETLALEVPAVLIPNYAVYGGRLKINAEQLYRMQRLEDKGLAAFAHPEDVQQSDKFAEILVREYARQTSADRPRQTLNFSGATNTIVAISDLLREKQKIVAPPDFSIRKVPVASP